MKNEKSFETLDEMLFETRHKGLISNARIIVIT
jgi:hypothetical protein